MPHKIVKVQCVYVVVSGNLADFTSVSYFCHIYSMDVVPCRGLRSYHISGFSAMSLLDDIYLVFLVAFLCRSFSYNLVFKNQVVFFLVWGVALYGKFRTFFVMTWSCSTLERHQSCRGSPCPVPTEPLALTDDTQVGMIVSRSHTPAEMSREVRRWRRRHHWA